ncbi:MAG TPA: CobD/CbiB family cobalamin biosynthesis protein [Solirubrobacteraceae bacterium]|nr:CobD/CbiB family cobalamin biosynthesis protein [Solirubrobacteraceae bacterium]
MSGAALLAGYAADLVAGDPSRWHPVAGFGTAASTLERAAYAPTRARGVLVTGALVIAAAAGTEALARRSRPVALITVTWAALGGRSLRQEALHVADLIERDDLVGGRAALRALCGRDAEALDAGGLSRAVVESVAENTSDAVVGALVWGAVGGPAGVAAYRAANTLDAMFGHRSQRYAAFGWFAAKLDDAMNWPAARLSAALTCAVAGSVGGSPSATLATVRRDGPAHPSPNAGMIEAAFAQALGVQLGGPLAYGAHVEQRPRLGDGRPPEVADIRRATHLSLIVSTAAALACTAVRTVLGRR